MESHESLGYPPFPMLQDVVLLDIDVPRCNENIHDFNHPKKEF